MKYFNFIKKSAFLFFILLIIFFHGYAVYSGTIELFNGGFINFSKINLTRDTAVTDKKNIIQVSEIKKIEFIKNDITDTSINQISRQARNDSAAKNVIDDNFRLMEVKADVMKTKYQGVGAVIILDEGWQQIFPDGKHIYKYHFIGKIYNEDYLNWGVINLYYTEGRSAAKITSGRSIDKNGNEYKLNSEDIKTLTPSQESQYFDKSGKTISAKIPGVKTGSILEYTYEIETYNPFDKHIFSGGWYFQDNIPVVKSEYHIIYPKEKKINIMFRNLPESFRKPVRKNSDDTFIIDTYKMEDVPPIYPEPYMPNISDVKYSLNYTFLEDRNYLYEYISKIQKERLIAGDKIKSLVDSIKQKSYSDTQLMADLFHWVETNIRYVSVKSSVSSGWSGHPAEETFINKFGDCTDVSILYCAMLNYAGIEAYPVIINTNDAGELITDIPVPDGNHCITEIRYKGNIFYVDPTSETYRFPYLRSDDNGVKAVNYIKKEIGYTGLANPDNNQKKSNLEIEFDISGNAECSIINTYTGPYEAQVRNSWRHIKKQDTAKVMQNYVSSITPTAVFKNFNISDLMDLNMPLKMAIQFEASNMWEKAGDLFIVKIPTIEKKFDEIGLEKRKYDIHYNSTSSRINSIKIKFPKNHSIKFFPDNLIISNDFFEYSGEFTLKNNFTVEFNEIFIIKQRIIPAEKYQEFKNGLQKISEFSQNRIFIKTI